MRPVPPLGQESMPFYHALWSSLVSLSLSLSALEERALVPALMAQAAPWVAAAAPPDDGEWLRAYV